LKAEKSGGEGLIGGHKSRVNLFSQFFRDSTLSKESLGCSGKKSPRTF